MSVMINTFTSTFSYWTILEIFLVILVVLLAVTLYTYARLIGEKRRGIELKSHLTMMEKALEEFRNIRHQYNNMFQSVVFYIENEQWDSDKNFVNEILEKTSELNKNNMLQIVKIKNCTVKSSIFKIAEICDKNGIDFSIFVAGEVNCINMHESVLCRTIETIFNYSFDEVMRCGKKGMTVEISADSRGVLIIFESNSQELSCDTLNRKAAQAAIMKINAKNKNVIFNSYIDNDYYKQELMIL